jgi:hypothetical protein
MQGNRLRTIATALAGGALLVGGFTIPAIAQGGHGKPESGLTGRAQVVRTSPAAGAHGRTHVDVHLRGLRPGATYGVHLHNRPCAEDGGTHYQHDPAGATTPPNEAWPSSAPHDPMAGITANPSGVASGRATAAWVADGRALSVVVHAATDDGGTLAGGPKIACADLR